MKVRGNIFLLSWMYMRRHWGEMELMHERVCWLHASMEKEQQAVLYGAVMSRKKIDVGVFQIDMIASSPKSEGENVT